MESINNDQKYLNYKEQFKRLDKALKYGFNLEAVFIEYAIMEDRAEAVLRYEGNEIHTKERQFVSIDRKLKKIKDIAREKKSLPNRYFTEEFIDEILSWKEERNGMIHAFMKKQLTTESIEAVALKGKDLARQMANKATNYRRSVERRNKGIIN